jgi:hypothetical protein
MFYCYRKICDHILNEKGILKSGEIRKIGIVQKNAERMKT